MDSTDRRRRPGSRPLPARFTRFLGRDAEAVELAAALEGSRLVTLVGPPGCGKTRLSIELAERLSPRVAGSVWFVELAALAAGDPVADAVAAAGGVVEEPGRASDAGLVDALGGAEVVIVLDNCEHVVTAVADLAGRLLSTCPGVRFLATSRAPLGVAGELVWHVAPLSDEAAVELFLDRAALASSPLGDALIDEASVTAICDGLAGLPLAIELAAAWTRVLSPAEIAARIGDGQLVLRRAGRGRSSRQATMDAAIDWSYQMLAPAPRRLFDRMSVFVGGADLQAIAAVAGAPGDDVLGALTVLVEQSLVLADVAGSTMRYRVLAPLRQFGAERLAGRGEVGVMRDRHAEHYRGMAERCDADLRGARRAAALRRLEQEDANLRLALTWYRGREPEHGLRLGAALAHVWELRGRVNEGRDWLKELLGAGGADPGLRATALARAGRLAWRQRDYRASRAWLEESLAIKRELGDASGVARRLRGLALVAMSEGDVETARRLCDECIATFRAEGDDRGLVWALIYIGLACYAADDLTGGDARIGESMMVNERVGDSAAIAYGHLYRCYSASIAGDPPAARSHFTAAISALDDVGGVVEEPEVLWSGAALAASERRLRAALRLAAGAEALSRRSGSHLNEQIMVRVSDHLDRARRDVGPKAADRLRTEGARMDLDELVAAALAEPGTSPPSPLSTREREIAELMADGLSNGEVAEKAFISKRTVESHIDHIKHKLGLRARSEIIGWIRQHPDEPA